MTGEQEAGRWVVSRYNLRHGQPGHDTAMQGARQGHDTAGPSHNTVGPGLRYNTTTPKLYGAVCAAWADLGVQAGQAVHLVHLTSF